MTSHSSARVLAVIPARGGSKGIPRKNLRGLCGKPLIQYTIETAQASRFISVVCVTSDDEEILAVARGLGATGILRDGALADDAATLDPVVHDACARLEAEAGERFDVVVTLQPTSPLLKAETLDAALGRLLAEPGIDTILSARSDPHLSWTVRDGRYVPNYEARVNRQYLPPEFRETGGFLISRRASVGPSGRIGKHVELHLLGPGEAIDIDTSDDWALCEHRLRRRRILFVVTGNRTVGLGHVHNALLVANDLVEHEIEFLVDADSELAATEVAARNYPVRVQSRARLVDDVLASDADAVVNDILDTDEAYVGAIRQAGKTVINFEDLGPGARLADLVVNAIYPEADVTAPGHYFGHRYMVLRDEFFLVPTREIVDAPRRVLLTFGGVDPANLTLRVLQAIHGECLARGLQVTVVAGLGYEAFDSLAGFSGIEVIRNTRHIAGLMAQADVVFTSAGRTTYEVAAVAVPCIVLAQNERELTHLFARRDNGFLHLGLGKDVDGQAILEAFRSLLDSQALRADLAARMRAADLRSGRERVAGLVRRVLASPSSAVAPSTGGGSR